jgi:hypothetical protein
MGPAAGTLFKTVGLAGIAVIVVLGAVTFLWRRRRTGAPNSGA